MGMNRNLFIFIAIISFWTVLVIVGKGAFLHRVKDGQLERAYYVFLPGYETWYSPEHTMPMSNWIGTKLISDSVTTNVVEQEYQAARVLSTWSIFSDYTPKLMNGHWVLYQASSSSQHWAWKAPYRIGLWYPTTDM